MPKIGNSTPEKPCAKHCPSYEQYLENKLNSTASESRRDTLRTTIQTYADGAGIGGVRYFAGSIIESVCSRVFWSLVFATSLIMGIVVFVPIWNSFMNKATLNLQDTAEMTELEFPAITFCSLSKYKRSVVGFAFDKYMRHDPQLSPDISVSESGACNSTPFYKTVSNFPYNTTWFDHVFGNPKMAVSMFGYHHHLISSPSAYSTVQSCIFKGQKLTDYECYSAFHNRILSGMRVCFTFNPSNSLRSYGIGQLDPSFSDKMDSVYPAPLPGVIDFKVKAHGKPTAVEFLLNIQQYEYCPTSVSDGAGITLQVHSRDVQPVVSELMNDVIQLSPGKDVTISIEEQHTVRETESAGWCASHVHLKYFEHMDHYDRDACFIECLGIKIFQACGCTADFVPAFALKDRFAEIQKQSGNDDRFAILTFMNEYCVNDSSCKINTMNQIITQKSMTSECPKCKVPCFERNYRITKSESDFPATNNFEIYQHLKYPKINYTALRQLNVKLHDFTNATYYMENLDKRTYETAESFKNIAEVKQNLIHLRIKLHSMSVVVNKEIFAIGISELITQFGGAISLFIGASMLSFIEIGYWCFVGIKNLWK